MVDFTKKGLVSFGFVWFRLVSFCFVLFGLVSFGFVAAPSRLLVGTVGDRVPALWHTRVL